MVHSNSGKRAKRIMKWKQIERMQAQKPKKKGWIVKPQYIGDVLLLDIYTDKILESRYCIDIKTGEHGYQKVGENWKKGKLITCLGGDPMEGYRYYCCSYGFDINDIKFDSVEERKETEEFLERTRYRSSDWHKNIEYLEMKYDREKRWDAEMKKSKRQQDLINQIPALPENIREWIYEKESEEEYIFYDKRKGKWGCSCCGTEISDTKLKRLSDGGKVRHNDWVECPKCKKKILAKKRTDKVQKKTGLYLITQINKEASVIRYYDANIRWEYGRHTVVLDEAILVMAYKIGVNPRRKCNVRLFYADEWGNFGTGNRANKRAKKGWLYPGDFNEALENTEYKDGIRTLNQLAAAGEKLNYNKLLVGIQRLLNFENVVEYLFKGRFRRMLKETIEKVDVWESNYYGKLKLTGTTLEEVFLLQDKQKINRIRDEDGGERMLEWMWYSDKTGKKISKETIAYMEENEISPKEYANYIESQSPQQIQNYLEKQRAAGYKGMKPKEVLDQWLDYLSMCVAAGKDLTDDMVLKPRDLKLRHNQAVADANQLKIVKEMQRNKEYRAEKAEEMRKKYPEAEKNLDAIRERYEYKDEEYIITVPHDLVEIIEDGQALHHCAGASERYFDRIESRETYICFLRRAETPKIPFYTIEVEPSGTIRQHRSYLDEEPGIEEIRGFLRKWQKELKKRLTEEDKRLAKISKEKRELNIKELEEKNNTRVLKGLAEDFMENLLDFEEIA